MHENFPEEIQFSIIINVLHSAHDSAHTKVVIAFVMECKTQNW